MKILGGLLIGLCLFAQGDGFTSSSGMWFNSAGRFEVDMEAQASNTPGLFIADRTQAMTDEAGHAVFPKKISFSGTASFRPRGHRGDYEYIEDSLISLIIEGDNGHQFVIFRAILKANGEPNTVYVPTHVLPELGSLPLPPVGGGPLKLHLNVGMAGRGGSNTELAFTGHWE